MYHLPYNKDLKEFSQLLRNRSTKSEIFLWQYLKNKQMHGFTFNRQKPLGRYIVDFYCKELNLVIEVDGDSHHIEEAELKDAERQKVLEELGLYFLRYDDLQVKNEMHLVLLSVSSFVTNPPK